MADEAYLNVPWAPLGKVYRKKPTAGGSSVAIEFYDDDKKVGTLKIGRSSIIWKSPHSVKGKRMSIQKLGELFEEWGD